MSLCNQHASRAVLRPTDSSCTLLRPLRQAAAVVTVVHPWLSSRTCLSVTRRQGPGTCLPFSRRFAQVSPSSGSGPPVSGSSRLAYLSPVPVCFLLPHQSGAGNLFVFGDRIRGVPSDECQRTVDNKPLATPTMLVSLLVREGAGKITGIQ